MANILVVVNEAVLLTLISNTSRLDGHNVTALCDPLGAIAPQAPGQSPIDLLLTDIDMKPISGFELVKRLNKKPFNSPVLFTSGRPTLSGIVARGLGARSILEKPFTATQLKVAIRNALPRSE